MLISFLSWYRKRPNRWYSRITESSNFVIHECSSWKGRFTEAKQAVAINERLCRSRAYHFDVLEPRQNQSLQQLAADAAGAHAQHSRIGDLDDSQAISDKASMDGSQRNQCQSMEGLLQIMLQYMRNKARK